MAKIFSVSEVRAKGWKKVPFINWYLVLFESSGVSDCLSAKMKMSEMTTHG